MCISVLWLSTFSFFFLVPNLPWKTCKCSYWCCKEAYQICSCSRGELMSFSCTIDAHKAHSLFACLVLYSATAINAIHFLFIHLGCWYILQWGPRKVEGTEPDKAFWFVFWLRKNCLCDCILNYWLNVAERNWWHLPGCQSKVTLFSSVGNWISSACTKLDLHNTCIPHSTYAKISISKIWPSGTIAMCIGASFIEHSRLYIFTKRWMIGL